MFTQLLKSKMLELNFQCEVVEEHSKGQKERRMCDTLEGLFLSHRLVVLEDVIRNDYKDTGKDYQLFYQLTRLTRDKGALVHDDRGEALSMVVADLVEHLARDTTETEEDHKRKLREKMLMDYLASFGQSLNTMDDPLRYLR